MLQAGRRERAERELSGENATVREPRVFSRTLVLVSSAGPRSLPARSSVSRPRHQIHRLDRRRREAEDEHHHGEDARATSAWDRAARPRRASAGGAGRTRTASAPSAPSTPSTTATTNVRPIRHATIVKRDEGAPAAEHGVRDVPAIELADREQVQRRRQQPEPGGEADRVHVDVNALAASRPNVSHAAALNSSGSPSSAAALEVLRELDDARQAACPTNSTGTATRNPAIGPAMPMSNSWRLVGIGWRMRMKAPSVPVSGTAPAENRAGTPSTP